jgi:glycosyltransferase
LQFDIYGSIEEPQYWEECLKIINNFNNKIKINYCGVCKHDDIPIILSSYDALFFPTFSENYGHIIAESLSVGLPIIISDQTPWSNINSTKGGWAIPLKDEDMYLKAVESIIGCSSTEMRYRVEDSIAFFRKFTNIDLLRDDYLKSFSSLK